MPFLTAEHNFSFWIYLDLFLIFGHTPSIAHGTLVPQLRMQTVPSVLEGRVLTTGLPGKPLKVLRS